MNLTPAPALTSMALSLISDDGLTRVTRRVYSPGGEKLVVESRGGTAEPYVWYHVADCRTPQEVAKHVDLSTLSINPQES